MPIDIQIDTLRQRIMTRAYGRLTGDDLRDYYRRLHVHPDYLPNMAELWDASEVNDLVGLDAGDVRDFSMFTELYTDHGTPVPVAIVAPGDVAYGLARMYEMLQTNSINRLRVVRGRDEAEAWLSEAEAQHACEPAAEHASGG